ncbi:cytochrome c [Muricauda sp. MAR_2010_75]|uniref:c-type cytochrome n=1 Tax=Allomuricauda sp. MAR_2010_75 TaxID=1250232 RepID=UPI00068D149D|nr:cytochrome c [Muricauda sp. MAR_2010_75]
MRYLLACFCLFFSVLSVSQEFPSIPEEMIPTDDVSLKNGKKLFEKHCTQCHNIFEEQIGPPLAYVYRFYDYAWLHGFITNSQQMVAQGDALAIDIFNAYDKTIMPVHEFSEDEVWNLMGYIKKVSETKDYDEYFNFGSNQDEELIAHKKFSKVWWGLGVLALLSILVLFFEYKMRK